MASKWWASAVRQADPSARIAQADVVGAGFGDCRPGGVGHPSAEFRLVADPDMARGLHRC
jgi:hypothetical protein